MDSGLDGVIAANTVLSHVDGREGAIWVRGHTIGDLVKNHGFEGTVAILWEGFAGEGLTRAKIEARVIKPSRISTIGSARRVSASCSKACASRSPRYPKVLRRPRSP
jgi:citrate synthase